MERSVRRLRRMATNKHVWVIAAIIGALLFLIPEYGHRDTGIDAPAPEGTVLKVPEEEAGGTPPYAKLPPRPQEEGESEASETSPVELPSLSESDSMVRDLAKALSSHPDLAAWMAPDQLVRRAAVVVDNIASGKIPRQQLDFAAPAGPFTATRSDSVYVMDPASYRRYDAVVGVLTSIDVEAAADLYLTLRPLLNEAYQELGVADRTFDDALYAALDRVRKAKVVEGDVKLVRPTVIYKFEDPALEKLDAVQKQLLRMGPENTRKIQKVAEALALALFDWVEETASPAEAGDDAPPAQ